MDHQFWLAKMTFMIKKYNSLFEDLQKKWDMTQIEIDTLAFLANNPEYNHAQDIVNIRGISKAHVSVAIEKLVKRGWLKRLCDPDNRRCNILQITKDAKEVILKIQNIQNDYATMAFNKMNLQEQQAFVTTINQIYQNLGGQKYDRKTCK